MISITCQMQPLDDSKNTHHALSGVFPVLAVGYQVIINSDVLGASWYIVSNALNIIGDFP